MRPISPADSSQPSRSKLAFMRDSVTLLGMTLVPRWMPHISLAELALTQRGENTDRTCCTVRPFAAASALRSASLYSGESVEPRHEYAVTWMPFALQKSRYFGLSLLDPR